MLTQMATTPFAPPPKPSRLGLELSSRAMFASWLWHAPTRTAFDCGEGFSLHMLTRIFGVERVLFSHGHQDHVGGLLSLIGLRAKTKGDTEKPLDIYYPQDNRQFRWLRTYVETSWPRLPYTLRWYPIDASFKLYLDKHHQIEAFPMQHQPNATTLGYRVVEQRSRLSPEWKARVMAAPQKEIGPMLAAARSAGLPVDEVYHAATFAYCLDNCGFDYSHIQGCDLAIADCTFLTVADRHQDNEAHASLDESVRRCWAVGVKHVVAAHASLRNRMSDVVKRAGELEQELGLKVTVCHPDRVLEL